MTEYDIELDWFDDALEEMIKSFRTGAAEHRGCSMMAAVAVDGPGAIHLSVHFYGMSPGESCAIASSLLGHALRQLKQCDCVGCRETSARLGAALRLVGETSETPPGSHMH